MAWESPNIAALRVVLVIFNSATRWGQTMESMSRLYSHHSSQPMCLLASGGCQVVWNPWKSMIWLVVYLPLWTIWRSFGMMTFPIYRRIKNVPNHQPVMVFLLPERLGQTMSLIATSVFSCTVFSCSFDSCFLEWRMCLGVAVKWTIAGRCFLVSLYAENTLLGHQVPDLLKITIPISSDDYHTYCW